MASSLASFAHYAYLGIIMEDGLYGDCKIHTLPKECEKTLRRPSAIAYHAIANTQSQGQVGMSKNTPSGAQTISMLGLADTFKSIHHDMPNRRFAFILGAGASKSSGIKLAGEMVDEWIAVLHRQSFHYREHEQFKWASAANLEIREFDAANHAAAYSALYQRMYKDDPDRGYAYLERQMANAEPSYGYSVLSRIMAGEQHNVVITVNFDNLVVDSLSIFGKTYPLVCGHESLAQFAHANLRRPLVLKVHRDLLLKPKSEPADLSGVEPQFDAAIVDLLQHYTPIVIGYGGNDDSLMRSLESIPAKKIPGGVYWCYLKFESPPPTRIQDFVAKQCGKLVPILGFDELMISLGGALGLSNPDKLITERAQERVEALQHQEKELQRKLEEDASKPFLPPNSSSTASGGETNSKESESVLQSLLQASGKSTEEKPWWRWAREAASEPDPDKCDAIYRRALLALPNSAQLMNNYAVFLKNVQKDFDAAQAMYERAIVANPNDANYLCNFANFLTDVRHDNEAAEQVYQRAIEVDPDHPNSMGSYAVFLEEVIQDFDKAESMYRCAIDAAPRDADYLCNYANFLTIARHDPASAKAFYHRALEADPAHANSLGSYAAFLEEFPKDFDAAEAYFERAIEADPRHANNLKNYADFLAKKRKNFDSAQAMFTRAVDADPNDAIILATYANFLYDVRRDFDTAEIMYLRAVGADPTDAEILRDYAHFLLDGRDDHDAAQKFFLRALDADPANAESLNSYAQFLADVRGDQRAANFFFSTRKKCLQEVRLEKRLVENSSHTFHAARLKLFGVIAQAEELGHERSE
jgi:Tfp pilus assembly protein PilF